MPPLQTPGIAYTNQKPHTCGPYKPTGKKMFAKKAPGIRQVGPPANAGGVSEREPG